VKPSTGVTPICERDGFPKLTINGRLECVAEYLDRCIGYQPIVDVVQHGKTFYYVFANGHELPLLCACCGGPLLETEEGRQDMRGRRLVSMVPGVVKLDDGREIDELILEFSKKGWLSRQVPVHVSFNVAVHLRHPAGCPYNKPSLTPSKAAKKKRRP
jgi:hypothetical protein